jgi:hypothetical protein
MKDRPCRPAAWMALFIIVVALPSVALGMFATGCGGQTSTANISPSAGRSSGSERRLASPSSVVLKEGNNDEFSWSVLAQRRGRSQKVCFGANLFGPRSLSGIAPGSSDGDCGVTGSPPRRVLSVPALNADGAHVTDVGLAVFPASTERIRLTLYEGSERTVRTRRLPGRLTRGTALRTYRYAAFLTHGCVSRVDALSARDATIASYAIPVCRVLVSGAE